MVAMCGSDQRPRQELGQAEAFHPATDEFEQVADQFTGRRPDLIASSVFRERFGEEMLFALRNSRRVT